jgi:hypothetical protein
MGKNRNKDRGPKKKKRKKVDRGKMKKKRRS